MDRLDNGVSAARFTLTVSAVGAGVATGLIMLLAGIIWWVAALSAAAVTAPLLILAGQLRSEADKLPPRIDPFALKEPWRFYVRDALQARKRVEETLAGLKAGPLRTRLLDITNRLGVGVDECWRISQRAQTLTDARRRIDVEALNGDLATARIDAESGPIVEAIENQLASALRLDTLVADTTNQLQILNARMEEAAVRATELASVSSNPDSLGVLVTDVHDLVDELEALRLGLEATDPT